MYELVYWRFGTAMTEQYKSKEETIAEWIRGLDYNEFWSPGFVDRDRKVAYLDAGTEREDGLKVLEAGLGISLAEFKVEFFKIPKS